jgi:hypothetical protein
MLEIPQRQRREVATSLTGMAGEFSDVSSPIKHVAMILPRLFLCGLRFEESLGNRQILEVALVGTACWGGICASNNSFPLTMRLYTAASILISGSYTMAADAAGLDKSSLQSDYNRWFHNPPCFQSCGLLSCG